MSDLSSDRPQEMSTNKSERNYKGTDLTVVCSVLIIAVAVITVYFMSGKDASICCNFAQELNITKKLVELEIRMENLQQSLEKEMQREKEGTDLLQIMKYI